MAQVPVKYNTTIRDPCFFLRETGGLKPLLITYVNKKDKGPNLEGKKQLHFLVEANHPSLLGKQVSLMKLAYKLTGSLKTSALPSFLG
jgi:hypothetical protein